MSAFSRMDLSNNYVEKVATLSGNLPSVPLFRQERVPFVRTLAVKYLKIPKTRGKVDVS